MSCCRFLHCAPYSVREQWQLMHRQDNLHEWLHGLRWKLKLVQNRPGSFVACHPLVFFPTFPAFLLTTHTGKNAQPYVKRIVPQHFFSRMVRPQTLNTQKDETSLQHHDQNDSVVINLGHHTALTWGLIYSETGILWWWFRCNLHASCNIKYLIKIISAWYTSLPVIKHTHSKAHTTFAPSLLTVKSSGNRELCTMSSCILHLQAYLPISQSKVVRPDEAGRITVHLVSSYWPYNMACI